MSGRHIVFIAGEPEYKSEVTMPALAKEVESHVPGVRTTVLTSFPDPKTPDNIPGLDALASADLAVFFVRFLTLPAEQVAPIEAYLKAGGPVVGFRTSTHAFRYPDGHPLAHWNDFGRNVLGAPWIYHYGGGSSTVVTLRPEAANHPILAGVDERFQVRSWLYQVRPDYPPASAQVLADGFPSGKSRLDQAQWQSNPVAWTWTHWGGGRVFITTMGHPEDFEVPAFRRMVLNGIAWALRSL